MSHLLPTAAVSAVTATVVGGGVSMVGCGDELFGSLVGVFGGRGCVYSCFDGLEATQIPLGGGTSLKSRPVGQLEGVCHG